MLKNRYSILKFNKYFNILTTYCKLTLSKYVNIYTTIVSIKPYNLQMFILKIYIFFYA